MLPTNPGTQSSWIWSGAIDDPRPGRLTLACAAEALPLRSEFELNELSRGCHDFFNRKPICAQGTRLGAKTPPRIRRTRDLGRGGRERGAPGRAGRVPRIPAGGGGPGTGGRGGSEGRRGGGRAHPPPQKPRKLQLAGLSPGPEVFGRFYFGEWGGLASQGARPGERARAINAAWARGGLPAGLRPAAKEPRGTQAKEP